MTQNLLNNNLGFNYIFKTEGGEVLDHVIEVSQSDIISKVELPANIPEWAKLEHKQCKNCTLKDSEYCPVALRLIDPIKKFSSFVSHTKADVTVITNERTYSKHTDMQDGLRSMFGLIMATSGCPSMHMFRTMALYHLPFASINETIYRIASAYLVKQFSEHMDKSSMPVSLDEIEDIYANIEQVNIGMRERLATCVKNDSTLNAIIILDSTAAMLPFKLKETITRLGW